MVGVTFCQQYALVCGSWRAEEGVTPSAVIPRTVYIRGWLVAGATILRLDPYVASHRAYLAFASGVSCRNDRGRRLAAPR